MTLYERLSENFKNNQDIFNISFKLMDADGNNMLDYDGNPIYQDIYCGPFELLEFEEDIVRLLKEIEFNKNIEVSSAGSWDEFFGWTYRITDYIIPAIIN